MEKCAEYDGFIASAPSLDIQDYLFERGGNGPLILGAKDTGDRVYVWEDGTAWNWTNWSVGQPNELQPTRHCIYITSQGTWNVIQCDTSSGSYKNYMCQVRAAMMRERYYFSERDLDRL